MNLICIPFAGGTKYSFDFLKKYFNTRIDFFTVELPGHGSRIGEPLLCNLKEIISDIYINYSSLFRQDYILFGHSMGAVLAYLLAEKLEVSRFKKPKHLILSSHGVIDILIKRKLERYKLDNNAFKKLVKKFGGIPEEIINHEEAYNLFEKILRADFKALDTYTRETHLRLSVPLTVICGDKDICTFEEIKEWSNYTSASFNSFTFSGGHFYIFEHEKKLSEIITTCCE